MATITAREYRGWEIVTLATPELRVDVVPGKGGDLTSLVHLATGTELLWQTRWGLRARGSLTTPGSSEAALSEAYPGGWQSVFPNTGDAAHEHGVEWAMHGEVWTTPFDWQVVEGGISLTANLVRSPFRFEKLIEVDGACVRVSETATNIGNETVEVTWSQHPAFGAPLIGPDTCVQTNAKIVTADILDHRYASVPTPQPWPRYTSPEATPVDLSELPPPRTDHSRMAFLSDYPVDEQAMVTIVSPSRGLEVTLRWDAQTFPYAWYWMEAGGRKGFPWFSDAYVLAIEPASSWPGRGIAQIRESTGTQIAIAPGERVNHTVELSVATRSHTLSRKTAQKEGNDE
jgi:galactose mutarotase-like enzyme